MFNKVLNFLLSHNRTEYINKRNLILQNRIKLLINFLTNKKIMSLVSWNKLIAQHLKPLVHFVLFCLLDDVNFWKTQCYFFEFKKNNYILVKLLSTASC